MTSTLVANSVTRSQDSIPDISSNHYALFTFSIRSEVTRKYYERRIRHFLDFINVFDVLDEHMILSYPDGYQESIVK